MSFFDSLRKASFRGFEFAVESDEAAFGRDVKKHAVINGEAVQYEDTGVKPRSFTVEAVIGGTADFIAQADRFEALLSQKGEGRLVLPHTGEMTAVVTEARRRHSSREVGIVYFSVTFERAPAQAAAPDGGIASASALLGAANSGFTAALEDFTARFRAAVPDSVMGEITGQLGAFGTSLESALARAGMAFTAPAISTGSALALGGGIVETIRGIVARFEPKLLFSVGSAAPSARESVPAQRVVRALAAVAGIPLAPATDEAGPSTVQTLRAANTEALDLLARMACATGAAQAAAYAAYDSQAAALRTRAGVLGVLSGLRAEAGTAGWRASYTALGSLMAALNRDIDKALGRLPATLAVRPAAVRSATLLAHRLYGDTPARVVPMAGDIVRRNAILHPSFIPAAETLEVLADA